MAIKVTVPTRRGGVVTTTTSTSKVQTATKLEGLSNVDLSDAQDGHPLARESEHYCQLYQ